MSLGGCVEDATHDNDSGVLSRGACLAHTELGTDRRKSASDERLLGVWPNPYQKFMRVTILRWASPDRGIIDVATSTFSNLRVDGIINGGDLQLLEHLLPVHVQRRDKPLCR